MKSAGIPKVTFGTIVFNGEPFTSYCLRALYPFAHELIVVEGACKTSAPMATSEGHSTDGTLETLYRFKAEEDPENKLQIVVRDGFWEEKDAQSQAYAERATGDYLWQVDIDEFYRAEDMSAILRMLAASSIDTISFVWKIFWGGFDYICDGPYLHEGWCARGHHRLFKWGKGYRYVTHRPVTVVNSYGRDLRDLHWVDGPEMARRGIYLYHYSVMFPKQVTEKAQYYAAQPWGEYSSGILQWANENFLSPIQKPFQVHNVHTHPSWIQRFSGDHPEQIEHMKQDIEAGRLKVVCRNNEDVEKLLSLTGYRAGRWLLKSMTSVLPFRLFPRRSVFRLAQRIGYDPAANRLFLADQT